MKIRAAQSSDSAEIARLTVELGYAADETAVRERLRRIHRKRDQAVLVAVLERRIVGWLQAHASVSLESGFRVEIVGLIVDPLARRKGIGRALVHRAGKWASENGSNLLIVRSNTKRVESHSFYAALGFSATKTQNVYRKTLGKRPDDSGG